MARGWLVTGLLLSGCGPQLTDTFVPVPRERSSSTDAGADEDGGVPLGFPSRLRPDQWAVTEATEQLPVGRRRVVLSATVMVPAAFELRMYSGQSPTGEARASLTRRMVPGETLLTSTGVALGTETYTMFFWRRLADDIWARASTVASLTIAGAVGEPPTMLPALSPAASTEAIAAPLTKYDETTNGIVAIEPGPAPVAVAVTAFNRDAAAQARLLEQLRFTITAGHEPAFTGGWPSQYEVHVVAMFAIASRIPAVWSQLSTDEVSKVDALMKAALVANAFVSSDRNPFLFPGATQRDLRGSANVSRSWSAVHRFAKIANVLCAMAYFGGPGRASALLGSYDHEVFLAELQASNLPAIARTFARTWGQGPSASQIETAVNRWSYFGRSLADIEGLVLLEANLLWSRYVSPGLNGGAGRGGAGRMLSGQSSLPNSGQPGMSLQLDMADSEGERSSMEDALSALRLMTDVLVALMASGHWHKPANPSVSMMLARMHIGVVDIEYKIGAGYADYANGSPRRLWNLSLASSWGFSYTFGLYTNVIRAFYAP